jgi:Fur family ferric uptake transcriptional regulator
MIETSLTPTSSDTACRQLAGTWSTRDGGATGDLQMLLDALCALSHHDVEAGMREIGEHFDRVTLYRVLEWLVVQGLAHKVAAEDRSWRFNAILDGDPAYFQHYRYGRS